VYVHADDNCPLTTDELKEVTSDVLIDSRIEPRLGNEWANNPLFLSATIDCLTPNIQGGLQIYQIEIDYGNASGYVKILYDNPYGSLGTGGKNFILSGYKNHLERAITDYIKVNFDL